MRLATWRLYHVMTGEPGPPMTMITCTHLWLWLWSTIQTGTIAQRKRPVSRNCRTCRTSIWTIKVYIINIINQICIHGHLYNLSCGWCCLRGEWFLGVDLITYKVAFGKAQLKRCYYMVCRYIYTEIHVI